MTNSDAIRTAIGTGDHPFSQDEVYRAMRLLCSHEESKAVADAIHSAPSGAYDAPTQDLLILLSLLTSELATRVERFRDARKKLSPSYHDDEQWASRREVLSKLIESAPG